MRAPPSKKLVEALNIEPFTANLIRKIWKAPTFTALDKIIAEHGGVLANTEHWVGRCYHRQKFREIKRHCVDELLGNHGVEYLGTYKARGPYQGCDVHYSNSGDTYNATIIFIGDKMEIGDWGTLMECNLIKEREQP